MASYKDKVVFFAAKSGAVGGAVTGVMALPCSVGLIVYYVVCGFIAGTLVGIIMIKTPMKFDREIAWGAFFSLFFLFSAVFGALIFSFSEFPIWGPIWGMAILGAIGGMVGGRIFKRFSPKGEDLPTEEKTERQTGETNRKAVIGVILPAVPIALILLTYKWGHLLYRDLDALFLLVLSISPLLFIAGEIISFLSLSARKWKWLSITGIAFNGVLLALCLLFWATFSM